MALAVLDWDELGYPSDMDVDEIAHTIRHPYGGGYGASRAWGDKMQKRFTLYLMSRTTAQWLYLVEFWRARHGSADAFIFEFPVALYGSPSYGGQNIGEPEDGFDTDVDVGFGAGATFTVTFETDELPQKYRARMPQRWDVTPVAVREVA